MSTAAARDDAARCFVCGSDNAIGLKVAFRIEDACCRGEFTPGPDHVGFDDVVHGGILFSLLDDVMANWLYLQGARGYTARCDVRFRQPCAVGQTLALEARLMKLKGPLAQFEAVARRLDDQVVVVEAEAKFMVSDPGPLESG